MSDFLSFAEFDGQQVELLPARTVLSSWGCHYYCCEYDYYSYYSSSVAVDQEANAEADQYIINIGEGDVSASNEAVATNTSVL